MQQACHTMSRFCDNPCKMVFFYLSENSTFLKKCPECDLMYHYQEWSEGLHNYNSHIILTLPFCLLLQSLIQVYVEIIKKKKKHNNKKQMILVRRGHCPPTSFVFLEPQG